MATIDERVDDLSDRVKCLENKVGLTREEALKNNLEYYKMITKAVSEAINPVMEKLEEQNKRIVDLENADARKSQLILKTIMATVITTTVGWVVLGFLNNYMTLTTEKIKDNISEEAYVYEIIENII